VAESDDVHVTSGEVCLKFAVRDTGIGIPPEQQSSIFRAFEQGDASTTRKYGGTGLGLTISAQLVELMGGGFSVDSAPGRGSTFAFTVRFTRSSKPEAQSSELPILHQVITAPRVAAPVALRVLVAEDNELNVAVLREILSQRVYVADFANDGRDALELATANSYDLMVLDLHMPEMDGFDVVRAIRARERKTGGHLPIVALTARSSSRDREQSLAAGVDDFLSKPIEVRALWNAIDRAIAIYPPSPSRDTPLLDAPTILRVCGGRADVLTRLCSVFRETLPGHVARCRTALEEHDLARLRDAAHRLHGSVAAFSVVAGTLALNLEETASRMDVTSCSELVTRLEAISAELLEATRVLTFEDLVAPGVVVVPTG